MAGQCVERTTRRSLGISVFLLFIFIQMLTSLVIFAGGFVRSNKGLISPFSFCPTLEMFCSKLYLYGEAESEIQIIILLNVTIISLYSPVVLVAFALLAMLFSAYTKDRALLWLSMAFQAASSLLVLTGITVFMLLHKSHLSWESMSIWFYICVAVPLELIVTTVLSCVSGMRTSADGPRSVPDAVSPQSQTKKMVKTVEQYELN